jgi:hypothetical protein
MFNMKIVHHHEICILRNISFLGVRKKKREMLFYTEAHKHSFIQKYNLELASYN